MRTIERATIFKRDFKRELKGQHRMSLNKDLPEILKKLANDEPLEPRHHDHNLTGNWVGFRECHIKSDLLLIYSKPDDSTLRLARLGSHSKLFG